MKKFLLLIFIVFSSWQAMAGWEITQSVSDRDGMINYDVILIQDNILKYNGNDVGFIIDIKNNLLTFVMDQSKTYWKGSPDEFREGLNSGMKKFMEQMLAQIPEAQREMYSEMLDGMSEMYNTPSSQEIESINIKIEKTGDSDEIAGYDSEKYIIRLDGNVVETVWLSDELDFSSEFDMRKAHEMMNQIQPNAEGEVFYEYTDAYLDLIAQGYLMKSLESDAETVEVIKVVERNISDEEMSLTDDFNEVSIDEMLQQQLMNGDENGNDGDW